MPEAGTVIYDLVVKGGSVVTPDGPSYADVGISRQRIAAVGLGLDGRRMIDATGLHVLPGAVDGHVHLADPTFLPYAPVTADTFATGSLAAACGGVTTLIDFAQPAPGQPLLDEYNRRLSDAKGQAVIDYGLHLNLRDPDPARLEELPALFERGVPSFKLYMAYEGYRLPDEAIFRAMEVIANHDGLAILHAENFDIIQALRQRYQAAGRTAPCWHASACPAVMEGEAIHRALALAELAGVRIMVFHISCAEGVRELRHAKERSLPATGEVCVHYLALTADDCAVDDFHAQALTVNPPIRDASHQAALWEGVSDGTVDIVSTDHDPRPRRRGRGRQPSGTSSIEVRLALLYSLGVRTGRLSLDRWVDVCCSEPARIFGLTGKGVLAPGYDADIVLFDPAREVSLSSDRLHSNIDYCTCDGMTVVGWPTMTISRGEVIVEDGRYVGEPGRGRFVERTYQ
jgi:dihydropyrimidinase